MFNEWSMQILITGKGIELTPAIEAYVNEKISKLAKFFPGIMRVEIIVGMETHHHQKGEVFLAEAKIPLPGTDIFVKLEASSLYAAIDLLHDRLETELKKHKVKLRKDTKKNKLIGRENKAYHEEPEE